MDAVIVHTRQGAELLGGGENVHVIPHGAFDHLTRQADERPLSAELAAVEGPVVLYFGVVRPYKGVDVLLEAFRQVEGAELWVVGRPLGVSMEHLRRLAPPGRVRFVDRYVSDVELPAFFRRADVLVLPHRNVDVSGVLFAGLAFGKAMVMCDVGGFRELVTDHGAGRARAARRRRGAGRSDQPADRRSTLSVDRLEERAARGRGGALLVGPHRGADDRRLRTGAGVRVDLHGEVQALGGAGARLARGRGGGGGRGGGLGARRLHARRAARGPGGRAPRPAARERRRALRGAARRTWTW